MIEFLKNLRRADEATRKRWLVILSSVSMVIVIGFWVGYINLIVQSPDDSAVIGVAAPRLGAAGIFSAGINVVTQGIAQNSREAVNVLRSTFGSSNQIEIQTGERNFILNSLTQTPKTPLP